MNDEAPIKRLQKIADFRTTSEHLKKSGRAAILFGFLWVYLGVESFDGSISQYLYIGLGCCELLMGLRNRYFPTPIGFVLEGCFLILLGLYNIGRQLNDIALGGQPVLFSAIFAGLTIWIGFRHFKRYHQVRDAFDEPPSKEQLEWLDDIVAEIRKLKSSGSPEIVCFRSGLEWIGRRLGDLLIFIDQIDSENVIVDRRDAVCIDKGKVLLGSKHNAEVFLGERRFALAQFTPEMLGRFQNWLRIEESTEENAHGTEQKSPTINDSL